MKKLSLFMLSVLILGINHLQAGVNASCEEEMVPTPKLCSYDVKQTDNAVSLSWRVENNFMVDHFVVEKSTDGIQFEEVAIFKIIGDDSDFMKLTYKEDANEKNIHEMFRVKQFDHDGKEIDYNVITLK